MVEPLDQAFRSQLGQRILNYKDLRDRIREKLLELNYDLTSIEQRLEAAEELFRREFGLEPPGGERARRRAKTSGRSNGAGPSWGDAIMAVLRAKNRPMHVKEIWEALLASGFQTESRDPLRSVVSISVRHPEIERVGPNTYRLKGLEGPEPQLSLDGRSRAADTTQQEGEVS